MNELKLPPSLRLLTPCFSHFQEASLNLQSHPQPQLQSDNHQRIRLSLQEAVIKAIPKKKKCKKAKLLPEEALQIAVKRREAKGEGEKERRTHLKADFQRITRRDKKAFLSDQCKEIEENSRMGKTSDLL